MEKTKEELDEEIKALEEQKAKAFTGQETKEKPREPRPKDWDKYIKVSAKMQEVGEGDEKKRQFQVRINDYVKDVKLAVHKYEEAVILGRGKAISRAVELATHRFLEEDNITRKSIEIGFEDQEDKKDKDKTFRVPEIKIVMEIKKQ